MFYIFIFLWDTYYIFCYKLSICHVFDNFEAIVVFNNDRNPFLSRQLTVFVTFGTAHVSYASVSYIAFDYIT